MSVNDNQKREYIQAELKAFETQNDSATDRRQLHERQDKVNDLVETVADPVLKTEFRRRLGMLRGES